MHPHISPRITGHVKLKTRKRGQVWYARWRRADGSQTQRALGPAWTKKGRPPTGHFTRQSAERALAVLLADEQTKVGTVKPRGITFAHAAEGWLREGETERAVRPSTMTDYRATAAKVCEVFGATPIEDVTKQDVQAYKDRLLTRTCNGRPLSARTINRHLVIMGGIFRYAERRWDIEHNPAAKVAKLKERHNDGVGKYFSVEQVQALVRATPDPQDAALFLTAALTGLRQGELLALRWDDVDFTNDSVHVRRSFDQRHKAEGPTKSGRERSVPMVAEVATALAKLEQRDRFTDTDDLVFSTWTGERIDGHNLRIRYYAALDLAGLPRLRFHDLRHTFGTQAIRVCDVVELQGYMGHAHISTTQRYMHFAPRRDAAKRLAGAFTAEVDTPATLAANV